MNNRKTKKSGARIAVKVFLSLTALILVVVSAAVSYYYSKLDLITFTAADSFEVTDTLSEEILAEEQNQASGSDAEVLTDVEAVQSVETYVKDENITNILLIGTDTKGWKNSRSDCMIICSVNKSTHEVRLVSFMRDIYVKIPDYQGRSFPDQKMTHAFAYGGAQLLINTVQENFGVEIDNYVRVNFTVMPKLVSTLGGFGINLSASEAKFMNVWSSAGGYKPVLEEGYNWINGDMALIYARCRDDGDYNRTKRQQKVITKCAERLKEASPSRFNKFVNAFCKSVQTDMSQDEITAFVTDAAGYLSKLDSMEMITIPMKGTFDSRGKIVNGSYVLLDNREESVKAIHGFLYEGAVFDSESTYTGGEFHVKKTTRGTTSTTAVSPSDMQTTTVPTETSVSSENTTSTTVSTTSSTTSTTTEATTATTTVSTTTTTEPSTAPSAETSAVTESTTVSEG